MRSFNDTEGRVWVVAIHVAALKKLRAVLGVDLFKAAEDGLKTVADLINDPVRFVDALYVLCEDECRARSVDDAAFGRSFSGDVLSAAADVFVEEIIDFFPNPRVRTALRKMMTKGKAVQELMTTRMEAQLDAVSEEEILQTLSDSATGSPESSESSPTD